MRTIFGAIAGDIIGSYYERKSNAVKTKEFELFPYGSRFTDDTVMTLAVAKWIYDDRFPTETTLISTMRNIGCRYPHVGYGGKFRDWLFGDSREPYNSYGNGSAMRVSPVGFCSDSLEECLIGAEITAGVTHNHPEGIKGAQAVAACMFIALHWDGSVKDLKKRIKEYVTETFGYNLDRTLDEIRPTYHFDVSCQGSVPEAIIAFLEAKDYEDAIRNAVSLGGDADTQAAITGSIAACVWPIPENILKECEKRLTPDLLEIALEFDLKFNNMYNVNIGDSNPHMKKVTLLKDIDLLRDSIRSNYESISSPKQTFKTSHDKINTLKENEVFVFGSNLNGLHGGGAARIAHEKFGAIWGQGVGLQGQSYAIPTMQGGVETIKPYVDEFIAFAKANPDKNFLVTRIGCGIAGFRDEEIAPLFQDAIDVENIYLPESFVEIISNNKSEMSRHLESFVEIQNFSNGYEQALKEMKSGGKRGHWIWYIFPQIAGLGYSHMSQLYSLKNLEEAKAYLDHPVLGKRLREITEVVLSYPADADPNHFMLLPIDAMKLKSCMTLFDVVSPNDIFDAVLDKFYNGERDLKTLELL